MAQTVITKVGTPSFGTVIPPLSTSQVLPAADLGAMDACYLDSAGKAAKATATTGCLGFSPKAVVALERVPTSLYYEFEIEYGSGLTPGALIYLGPTAGAIYTGTAPASGFVSPVGVVVNAKLVRLWGNLRGSVA